MDKDVLHPTSVAKLFTEIPQSLRFSRSIVSSSSFHLESTFTSDTLYRSLDTRQRSKLWWLGVLGGSQSIAFEVSPDTVLAHEPSLQRVLIRLQCQHPVLAYGSGLDHDVDFLRMEPALSVLIAVPYDADVVIDD